MNLKPQPILIHYNFRCLGIFEYFNFFLIFSSIWGFSFSLLFVEFYVTSSDWCILFDYWVEIYDNQSKDFIRYFHRFFGLYVNDLIIIIICFSSHECKLQFDIEIIEFFFCGNRILIARFVRFCRKIKGCFYLWMWCDNMIVDAIWMSLAWKTY